MYYLTIEPHAEGLLEVGDGNRIWWAVSGNPAGKPAVVVHGGPGSGSSPGHRRGFDPDRYLIVQFDQRGCGRSTPHVADPSTDLSVNTTRHLMADMELLREHLGIERWLLWGGSWGCTLGLAYAEEHPERVSEIVLIGVTTGRREEYDWLYGGVRRFFPEAWEAFRHGVPEADRDGDVVAAYGRLMADPDPEVRGRAAADWCAWEDAVLSEEGYGAPDVYSGRPDEARQALVRLCAHYGTHHAFLDDGQLLDRADQLAGIPGVLLHGRADLSSPALSAWELSRRWPDAELQLFRGAGHKGDDAMGRAMVAALDRFADR